MRHPCNLYLRRRIINNIADIVLISVTDTILTYHTKDKMILHEIVNVKQFSRLPIGSLENKLFYNNQEVVLLAFLNQ